MRIPREYEGARLNMRRVAELLSMDDGHLRRLVRRGVFPPPRRTSKGLPYYDFELLSVIGGVLKRGVGISGEEVSFYRRKPKNRRPRRPRQSSASRAASVDAYIESVAEGCRQLGVGDDHLTPARIRRALLEEYGSDYEHGLEEVIPVLVRRLQGEQ
jgi:hypothetical protein